MSRVTRTTRKWTSISRNSHVRFERSASPRPNRARAVGECSSRPHASIRSRWDLFPAETDSQKAQNLVEYVICMVEDREHSMSDRSPQLVMEALSNYSCQASLYAAEPPEPPVTLALDAVHWGEGSHWQAYVCLCGSFQKWGTPKWAPICCDPHYKGS